MTKPPSHLATERSIKGVAYVLTGIVALAVIAFVVTAPQAERFHAKGPANTGHAELACAECHKAAPGTVRQQLQAKVQYWLGQRSTDAAWGSA